MFHTLITPDFWVERQKKIYGRARHSVRAADRQNRLKFEVFSSLAARTE
jgi:hypothetical protein